MTVAEELLPDSYRHRFAATSGRFHGAFEARLAGEGELHLSLTLTFDRAGPVNRAGFTVLHPIASVAGASLVISHPDGSRRKPPFPPRSPPASPPATCGPVPPGRPGEVAIGMGARCSRWRISATGPMPHTRPIAARCPCPAPFGRAAQESGRPPAPADHAVGSRWKGPPLSGSGRRMPQVCWPTAMVRRHPGVSPCGLLLRVTARRPRPICRPGRSPRRLRSSAPTGRPCPHN